MKKFNITMLGTPKVPSPIYRKEGKGGFSSYVVNDEEKIGYDIYSCASRQPVLSEDNLLELAGPRSHIFFIPKHVHAGIVACGGLCPGMNDVIRSLTRCLWYQYGVRRISGIPYGFYGFMSESSYSFITLNPDMVDDIHRIGGCMLGSSRGSGEKTGEIIDELERQNINMLFVIGGDGTHKGALAIGQEIKRRKLNIAVIGIPKTIDNDLPYVDKSFGFHTAVSEATRVVYAAHSEAHSQVNGIGLVKLMGRASGFIATYTALASNEVNFVLIPELPFILEGDKGLLSCLKMRLKERGHAVIVVAEGAGQNLLSPTHIKDESGNVQYSDIGVYLKKAILRYFNEFHFPIHLKYIDPSYLIRGASASPQDSYYCSRLAHNAVHAAMAGKTDMMISLLNNHYVHVPMNLVVETRNRIDPYGSLWQDVIEATGQPLSIFDIRG